MKTIHHLLLVAAAILVLASCADRVEETYKINEPQYLSYENLRTGLKVAGPEDIIQPGKIYFKDDFIFINEYQKGIHVVDNSDPYNPVVLRFIEIPGNVDMAIRYNILYVDSYVDLVSLDISDIDNIVEVDRDTNALPYIIPEYETGLLGSIDENKGVITGYRTVEKTESSDLSTEQYNMFPSWRGWETDGVFMANNVKTPGGSETGVGGSMARFTIVDGYLYIIDNYSLKLFDVAQVNNPKYVKSCWVGWNIETLFPYEDKLFIGSQSGMYVYDVKDASDPEYISQFRHASACDPVVVEGNYAYVTLRSGNLCGAIESQLDVIDISNIQSPELLKAYPMVEPYGLGINDSVLFVCDGPAGLKIYNASDPMNISSHQIAAYGDIHAFDVIPLDGILLMIGADGFYQYTYADLSNIEQISYIPIYGN